MIHVYKMHSAGLRTTKSGDKYDIKAITESDFSTYSKEGWSKELEFTIEGEFTKEEDDDSEKESLIAEIKQLGGKADKRSFVESLLEKLEDLKKAAE